MSAPDGIFHDVEGSEFYNRYIAMRTDNKGGVIGTCLGHVPLPPAQHKTWGRPPIHPPFRAVVRLHSALRNLTHRHEVHRVILLADTPLRVASLVAYVPRMLA